METGFIYAISAAIVWGLVYAIDQKILYGISPATLLFINSIITVIVLLPFIFSNKESVKILSSGQNIIYLIALSAILTALANFLIFSGIKNLDASTASIVEITYPFFVVLFSFVFFRYMPNIFFIVGSLLIFIGSMIIIKFVNYH